MSPPATSRHITHFCMLLTKLFMPLPLLLLALPAPPKADNIPGIGYKICHKWVSLA